MQTAVAPKELTDLRPAGPSPLWKRVLPIVALAAITAAVYYPVHGYGFINLDDSVYVTDNAHVLGPLNVSTVVWAFTHTIGKNYSPLVVLSHNLDVRMFGLHAGGHHVINLLFHIVNAVLLFLVLLRATGYSGRSFMVAALFALHPIQVENVAWISERKTVLSTLFFLLALGAYRWYAERPRSQRMAVVVVLFGLGVLAKPQVIILPCVLLLWDYWPLRRMFAGTPDSSTNQGEVYAPESLRTLVREKIPLFAVVVIDALLTMRAQHAAEDQQFPFYLRLGNAVLSYGRYLGKAFWPPHLAIYYLHPGYALPWLKVLGAGLLLMAITAVVIRYRDHRYLPVGWLWFLGALVPMIGLVQVDVQAMADRYAYIAFIGLFVMVCWGAAQVAEQCHTPRFVLPSASAAILLALSLLAHRQVGYWIDSQTLWTHTLDVTQRNYIADLNLASFARARGDLSQALGYLYQAVADKPTYADINLQIARDELRRGNLLQAIRYYEKVLTLTKDPALLRQTWGEAGETYRAVGNEARARQCFRQAALIHVPPPAAPTSGH